MNNQNGKSSVIKQLLVLCVLGRHCSNLALFLQTVQQPLFAPVTQTNKVSFFFWVLPFTRLQIYILY
jgi:hypothetical protein